MDKKANTDSIFVPKLFLKQLTTSSGVYQMFDEQGNIIYVGKANNLKNRVSSYFLKKSELSKTTHMVSKIHDIKVIITDNEVEALLLECNLIKQHKPRYNILLRDDKSYPYILLDKSHDFPTLSIYRGIPNGKLHLFGPFPNVGAVKETLEFLNQLFKLRTCHNANFSHRSRPCLEYQIKRCLAPCVSYISKAAYANNLDSAIDFLKGNSHTLLKRLEVAMGLASEALAFEKAVLLRDQIQSLRAIQSTQRISNKGGDADVLSVLYREKISCVVLLRVKAGLVVGSYHYFPKLPKLNEVSTNDILEAFVSQSYFHNGFSVPAEMISNAAISSSLEKALLMTRGKKFVFSQSPRGLKAKWLALAQQNSENELENHLLSKHNMKARYQALADVLHLDSPPKHMECFDISHTFGELTVASCVVFDSHGPKKSDYRTFNIEGITGGDDYAAMSQVLSRRYKRLIKENKPLPDLLIVDGGKGQVSVAKKVMSELKLTAIKMIGVAKGVSRKPGLETIIVAFDGRELTIESDNQALHLIQHIRDESHRFAITHHRKKRDTKKNTSSLESIKGVGQKRSQALLQRFGGMQNLKVATLNEIKKVPGINQALAENIYEYFNT